MPLSSVIRLLKNRNPAPGTRAYWPAIIAQQGYPYEEHFVTTRDGYVLSVHRISGPRGTKSGNANPRRKSVLLIHGLLMSSTGQDEMGEYDVPAMIDYILAQTGQSQLIYMGYSQGGRVGFMAATNTTVANKIKLLVSIAIGELQKFDFGVAENRRCYGRATPPVYDLSKILCPVAVYWAENDYTVKIKDVERLEKSLPNLIRNYRVTSDPFDHVDFVYSSKAKELVYPDLLELLRRI
ncbi:hypothetical protein HAZT_HAZT009254 [Hyalella azteca]|uniref:Uncharacterized protein n=1 Tax=Hyalella azteca TaxID=294128 RepID=A0A6A0HFD9_HYAAZ|nr:hypothetical protein HAZT_HAZT009254 [Hyalella azteca]